MLEVEPELLAERARLGLDHRDEMWDGELHMVPPPEQGHQRIGAMLLRVLGPRADERQLEITYETGVFGGRDDYRVPDLVIYRQDQVSRRGAEGAELVIEIRSPGDETMVKIPWYLAQGCREVLVIDRDTLAVELHGPAGVVTPARCTVLDCTFTTVAGPAVEVAWEGGSTIIGRR